MEVEIVCIWRRTFLLIGPQYDQMGRVVYTISRYGLHALKDKGPSPSDSERYEKGLYILLSCFTM
jgi:hypothetical protein